MTGDLKLILRTVIIAVLGFPAGSNGDGRNPPQQFDPANHSTKVAVSAAEEVANVRLLTASCAACHGTNGYSAGITPVLAGLGRDYFIQQMVDFKSGARPGTIMNHNASGYTYAEIEEMADFFSTLVRTDCKP